LFGVNRNGPEAQRLQPAVCFEEVLALHALAAVRELRRRCQGFEVQGLQEISKVHSPEHALRLGLP
jgi:hypothetical protein